MATPQSTKELDSVSLETGLLSTWQEENLFEATVENRKNGEPFIFLEGPPTANGKPGIHHVVARTYKDLVCRWKTMQGNFVERKGGWDTHGLPVEIEVQKRLDLMSNEAIEAFGMEEFNKECRESVWTYEAAWREMTERMAYWCDLDDPYVTLHNEYIESCWWALKQMFEKGLLYRGYKVLPYCPQTGTSYSSHEVALGYKEVEEPSVYVKFKLEDTDASILAWTTTPWTLPGNVGLAVGPDVEYVRVRVTAVPEKWEGHGGAEIGEELILAKDLFKEVIRHHCEEVETFPGSDLIGRSYQPLFPGAVDRNGSETAWTVIGADWVTTTDGTGVVHTAVMYGEDDYNLGMEVGLPAQHTVGMDGAFLEGTHSDLDGRYVKDCDETIIGLLHDGNLLYREKMYLHDYPHCWRTGHPLLYYAMDSWFVRMTAVKDRLLEFNSQVEWAPDWVGEGRFGEWLRNVKDWAISRERYWGTPLPVWICEDCGTQHCVGSTEEMAAMAKDGSPVAEDLHRPYVDDTVLVCTECNGDMKREPFVMDCWFDSGCASFAQWHHPFGEEGKFENNFPIDYICEGVDQTRGWFYTLLAVSTTVFDSICYKRCLSLGLILDAEGKKMSKSKGNIVDPWDHFNREGADATRWYMVTAGAPWNPLKFDPNGVRETYGKMFLTLWNIYRFHSDYAALDGFDPETSPKGKNTPLDDWVLSRLAEVVAGTNQQFEDWDFHKACRDIEEFVVNDVSNWYVRRSRRRLWEEADSDDKLACQHTLHKVLVTVSRLIAPVSPFMSDSIHRNLEGESVHMADWPKAEEVDSEIIETMALVRELAETGRRIRVDADRRQRLPCAEGWIVSGPDLSAYHEILAEELNVEVISLEEDLDRFQKVEVVPNRRSLGAKCRQDLPAVLQGIADGDSEAMLASVEAGNLSIAGYEISKDDIELRRVEREGFAAQTVQIANSSVSLVLDMSDSPELLSKGLARDITRRIQAARKDLDLAIEDTISLEVWMKDAPELFEEDTNWIITETRASNSVFNIGEGDGESFEVDGSTIWYKVMRS